MYKQKNPLKQIQGAKSKAVGAAFEAIIDTTCSYYKNKGTAYIEKTPEPMQPIKNLGGGKFIAFFRKNAQADYKGTLMGGRSIQFEAKHTAHDRIQQNAVTDAQAECLDCTEAMGGRCNVLVSFGFEQFYFVPWAVWKSMKQLFGRKYATREDLSEWEIKVNRNAVLDFLKIDVTGKSVGEIRTAIAQSLKDDTPRKPIAKTANGSGACPKCGEIITGKRSFCEWCGQAVCWND